MSLIHLIKNKEDLIKERDRLKLVLEKDLSLTLKPTKLNEKVAKILGAKDWNTALGIVSKVERSTSSASVDISKDNIHNYPKFYFDTFLIWIEQKLDGQSVHNLKLQLHTFMKSVFSKKDYNEEYSNDNFKSALESHKKLYIFRDANYILSSYGLYEDDFNDFLTNFYSNPNHKVLENKISQSKDDINIESILSSKDLPSNQFNAIHLIKALEINIKEKIESGIFKEFEIIDEYDDMINIEVSIIEHPSLRERGKGFKDQYVMKLLITNNEECQFLDFTGYISLWNCDSGEHTNYIDFKNEAPIQEDNDIPIEIQKNLISKIDKFISHYQKIHSLKTFI